MSAIDLFGSLDGIDAAALTPLQRILLITDGTLTEILEAHFLERIELVKISERMLTIRECGAPLAGEPGEVVMERKINLRGARSGSNHVYAESLVLVGRLDASFQSELLGTSVPLGRLWRHHRLETWKDLVSIACRPARELHAHLDCDETAAILARAYDVFSSRRLVMRISEYFRAAARD
ncbi:MAG TPA: chorismate pyruvate-lyase family protein [Rhizomicrobium sp.]|jgi:chorismate-pyruvate lyase